MTLPLDAERAGLLPLVPWFMDGIVEVEGDMASNLFAIAVQKLCRECRLAVGWKLLWLVGE